MNEVEQSTQVISTGMFLMVIGTRPEAIKMCPLYLKMKQSGLNIQLCITGQHRSMLDAVLSFFEIKPDHDLDVHLPGQNLNQLSAVLFEKLNRLYFALKPDHVLVHGDTLTSVVAAWSAFHLGMKVIHIEAGLRTYNVYSPFPEEFYRQVTSRIATLHFAPTEKAKQHLLSEGVSPEKVFVTGNTVIDALKWGLSKIKQGYVTTDMQAIEDQINPDSKLILVTAHRRENLNSVIAEVCNAILQIVKHHPDFCVLLPVHLNIEVRKIVFDALSGHPGVILTEPLDYPTFIHFMERSYFIMTDSGGIQEEATYLSKPVLVFRSTTERAEGVTAGNLLLTGLDAKAIVDAANMMLTDKTYYSTFVNNTYPFGDGTACESIVAKFLFN